MSVYHMELAREEAIIPAYVIGTLSMKHNEAIIGRIMGIHSHTRIKTKLNRNTVGISTVET